MSDLLMLPEHKPSALEQKQNKKKEELLDQLKKTPIVQIACEKVGVGRATFYRWRKDDKAFAEAVEQAVTDGSQLVSDMAESKLISAIKNENLGAIIFWLKSHHAKYRTKVEVNANIHKWDEPLSPEQEALVREALRLAAIHQKPEQIINDETNDKGHDTSLPSGGDDQRPQGQSQDH